MHQLCIVFYLPSKLLNNQCWIAWSLKSYFKNIFVSPISQIPTWCHESSMPSSMIISIPFFIRLLKIHSLQFESSLPSSMIISNPFFIRLLKIHSLQSKEDGTSLGHTWVACTQSRRTWMIVSSSRAQQGQVGTNRPLLHIGIDNIVINIYFVFTLMVCLSLYMYIYWALKF